MTIYTYLFPLHIHSPLLLENKVVMIAVFLSKLDHGSQPLFNYIYYQGIIQEFNLGVGSHMIITL